VFIASQSSNETIVLLEQLHSDFWHGRHAFFRNFGNSEK
jgi:hypothetical protein